MGSLHTPAKNTLPKSSQWDCYGRPRAAENSCTRCHRFQMDSSCIHGASISCRQAVHLDDVRVLRPCLMGLNSSQIGGTLPTVYKHDLENSPGTAPRNLGMHTWQAVWLTAPEKMSGNGSGTGSGITAAQHWCTARSPSAARLARRWSAPCMPVMPRALWQGALHTTESIISPVPHHRTIFASMRGPPQLKQFDEGYQQELP